MKMIPASIWVMMMSAAFFLSRTLVVSTLAVCLSACGNAAGDFVRSSGLGPKTAEAQDFVAKSRPENIDFIPVGTVSAGPANPAKKPDEVKKAEDELDSLRERNANAGASAAAAGGTPPPEPALMPNKAKDKAKAKNSP